jgi:outer membrane receptor protein involved in Fe transport
MASMPDDMGDGQVAGASLRVGVGASRTISKFRFALDVTGTHPFASTGIPQDAPPGFTQEVTSQAGDRISLSEGVSYLLSREWSLNTGLRQYWSGQSQRNGAGVDGTRGRAFTASVGASYLPGPDWRLNASYETQWPFYAYAVSLPYAPAVSIGMSYVGI